VGKTMVMKRYVSRTFWITTRFNQDTFPGLPTSEGKWLVSW